MDTNIHQTITHFQEQSMKVREFLFEATKHKLKKMLASSGSVEGKKSSVMSGLHTLSTLKIHRIYSNRVLEIYGTTWDWVSISVIIFGIKLFLHSRKIGAFRCFYLRWA